MKNIPVLLCLMLLAVPGPAAAWGPLGHRITGQLAQEHISPRTREAIERILGVEDLAEASTWPDDMRSDPSPFWQVTANPWHYVTVPGTERYQHSHAPAEGDAVTALRRFERVLRDPVARREDKALALRFTVHIIGDLHQPLHAGHGGEKADKGGNEFRVSWFRRETNLHSVWDSDLPGHKGLSYTEYAAWLKRRLTSAQLREWRQTDPVVWIAESTALRDRLYPESRAQLGYDYAYQQMPAVEQRLQMAGIRLAAYLDQVFSR